MRHRNHKILGSASGMLFGLAVAFCTAASAQDRMFFTGIVEENSDTATPQVLLIWGPFENQIPDEITGFRLYRRTPPGVGGFTLIAETSRALATVPEIEGLFTEAGEGVRRRDIQDWAFMDSDGAAVTGTAVYQHVHDVLSRTPIDEDYNPLHQIIFPRMNANVARSIGLAYFDRTALSGTAYEYMLTGLVGSSETKPLGKTQVDTTAEDILPAPIKFDQILVGGCDAIGRGIDDRRVHFSWDLSPAPEFIRERILTYGYDIYRADSDLGLLPEDIRNMAISNTLHPGLTRINEIAIIASGAPPTEGRDSFLAIDEGDIDNFDYLQRGRTYFYYLVCRDLSGKYSRAAGPLEARVPDSLAPPAPWAVRTEEIKDAVTPSIPRLQIVWEEMNKANWIRQYGSGRTFANAPPYAKSTELYFVPKGTVAMDRANHREVDLDVATYCILSFDTREGAQNWGVDTDGDKWPDNVEEDIGTDRCDGTSHPAGNPPELIAEIPVGDLTSLRTLKNGQKQRFFVDTTPTPNNMVWWYKIYAIDEFGNQSPLSPPIRGVLFDRDQPDVNAGICRDVCVYSLIPSTACSPTSGIPIQILDTTSNAVASTARAYLRCEKEGRDERAPPTVNYLLLAEREFREKKADFRILDLEDQCNKVCPDDPLIPQKGVAQYVVRCYDANGRLLGTSDPFSGNICVPDPIRCFELREDCRCRPVGPGEVLLPSDPLEICVELQPGCRARIFHELNGNMTPFKTILATGAIVQDYCETLDLRAIVPSGACIGVRVFSKNNVGSPIHYLNCFLLPPLSGGKPDRPLMHSVDPSGMEDAPEFTVRWAAQEEGLSAFVLQMDCDGLVRYKTYWISDPELSYSNGLYKVVLDLNLATELNVDCCIRVRALDKVLTSSDWSEVLCETWETEPPDALPWPPVPETPRGEDFFAYYLTKFPYPRPVLVLSGDLGPLIPPECLSPIPGKGFSEGFLQPILFFCPGICDQLRAANRFGEFIVYRQKMGEDFVQVGPLVDTFWCFREKAQGTIKERLDDPYIYLTNPPVVNIEPPPIRPDVDGLRLIYADPYPCKFGETYRWQLVVVDPMTGEGVSVHYSNWLTITPLMPPAK